MRANNPFQLSFLVGLGLMLVTPALPGQEGTQRGKFKKVDVEKSILVLLVEDKEVVFTVRPETRILGREGLPLDKALAGVKEGTPVMFRAVEKDGKKYLVGLRLDGGKLDKKRPDLPKIDSSKLMPLNELKGDYQGHKGGLYPEGKNERPAAHEAAGLARAKNVQPLDKNGKPHPEGKIVLLSIGMSNTSQASLGFQKALAGEKNLNPRLLFVNGAQGGMTAARIQNPEDGDSGTKYWANVDERLKSAGVTREQVQVIWIKQADAGPKQGFPGYARKLQEELARIVQLLPDRFPNAQLVYLSSRTYGGYARTGLNPEPYAYESAFSVRWLIEDQLKGEPALNYDPKKGAVKAPWLSWGPYLWANGMTKRPDGFYYEESDFAADGTHHSPAGQLKIGRLMLEFFRTDATSRSWFLGAGK